MEYKIYCDRIDYNIHCKKIIDNYEIPTIAIFFDNYGNWKIFKNNYIQNK